MTSEYIYTIDKQNGCILAECMQGKRGGSALERTPYKSNLMDSGGLHRFMTDLPRTYSQFLYNTSLAAQMLTVFKASTMYIKTTNHDGHMQL